MNRRQSLATLIAVAAPALTTSPVVAATKEEQRAEIRQTARQSLEQLYALQPAARKVVEGAAGYAVFSNFGMKILVAGGGSGDGLAVNGKTKAETFMKMAEVQAGLGFGIKRFRLIFVFESEKLLQGFVNSGWELGAQATAAAKLGAQGTAFAGAISVQPGVWLYQMTGDGLAAELTVKGTKYYKNSALN